MNFLRTILNLFRKPVTNGYAGHDMTSDFPLRYIEGTAERIQAIEASIRDGGC